MLKETIDSILNQTFRDFELIVVDNYSDYDFYSFIASFSDSRIRPFQNTNDGIIAVNRNYGIKKALGGYIAFCDDDDLWMPQKLKKQLGYFFDAYDVAGVGANSKNFGDTRYFRNKRGDDSKGTIRILGYEDVLNGQNVPLSSLVVKRNDILFPEDKDLVCVEDWDYQIQLTRAGQKIALLPDILVKYRVPFIKPNYPQKAENILHVVNKYRNDYTGNDYARQHNKFFRYMALRYLRAGDKNEALSSLKHADRYSGTGTSLARLAVRITPLSIIRLFLHLYYLTR